MNILIYSNVTTESTGGGSVSMKTTLNELIRKGHKVNLVNNYDDFKKNIFVNKPDIVMHQNIRGLIEVVNLCRKSKIPIITTINNAITCLNSCHTNFYDDDKQLGIQCLKCGPIKSVHCAWHDWRESLKQRIRNTATAEIRYWYLLKRRMSALNQLNGIIIIGHIGKTLLKNAGVNKTPYVIPQPINDSYLIAESEVKKPKKSNIIFLPKIDFSSGAHLIFPLFTKEKYKNFTLIATIGNLQNPKDRDFFEQFRNHPNIKLIDYVKTEEMKKLYQDSLFIIFPLIMTGLYGRTWAESIACGTPVLSFAGRGCAHDYLTHLENGYFVDVNMDALEAGIDELIANPKLREKLRINGWKYAKENLVASKVIPKIEAVLKEVVEAKS